jgi:hypothetical protein
MSKKIILTVLAFLLVACALTSIACVSGAIALPGARATATPFSITPQPTLTVDQKMDQIQEQVLSYRSLELKSELVRALMTSAELKVQVEEDFFKDYTAEDAKSDAEILSAMGLLDADFDLLTFYQELYAEQVAGYYDNETKEMYVVSDGGFGGMERMTYAHEFTHVLQDQNYDMENGLNYNDETCKADSEYCAAVSALIEGDASLSEYYWFFKYGTDKDKQQLTEFQQSYTSPVYDSAPAYMKMDFLFPYDQGYNFANALYGEGGWDAIDAAYANPPVSTEQILHPERYPDDTPIKVTVPDMLGKLGNGWEEVDRNVMGEWYTYLILAYGRDTSFQIDDETAKTAAEGWGGDTYVYYTNTNNDKFAFVWLSQWDTAADADEFYQASLTYGNARWGETTPSDGIASWHSTTDGFVTIRQSGDKVLWLMAPSKNLQTSILSSIPGMN